MNVGLAMFRLRLSACILAILLAPWLPAWGQIGPSLPVRIIVPFPPGGAVDLCARIVALKLSEEWNRSVVVQNEPGANGNIGAGYVARSDPDGTTLLLSAPGVFVTNRFLYSGTHYDLNNGLSPVSLVASAPNVLVVSNDLSVTTLSDLIALAKQKPGALSYASQGVGSTGHLTGALMASSAAIDIFHVPFRGEAPAISEVMAGRVSMMWNSMSSLLQYIQAGQLRALAVASRTRSQQLPDVPTANEAGLAGFESSTWFAVAAPAGTPASILANISQSIARAVRAPDVSSKISAMNSIPIGSSPDEMREYVASEAIKWKHVIEASHLKPE
jgi:tripartite-type tricarboxylate transporter receptor subunit TctC